MAPSVHEVEVSVFGPGYGECVVAHIGHGEWMIVDSCLDRPSKRPAALQYLESIGVNAEQDVKLVVATHWHDDHIRGLGEVVEHCAASRFICSGALRAPEVSELAFAYRSRAMMQSTGIDEISRVLDVLRIRRSSNPQAGPEFAQAGLPLLRREAASGVSNAEVHALSPSSASIALAQARLVGLLPKVAQPKLRLPALEPNDCSVALWLRVADTRVLLGADLEERNDPQMGWQAVINSPVRPSGRAEVVKIAHHGSENGDYDGIWRDLLSPAPTAVTTPFIHGDLRLPTETDVERIKTRTRRAYLTAHPREARAIRRPGLVDKMIRQFAPSLRPIDGRQGHVRLRRNLNPQVEPEWRIELFGDAYALT